MKSYLKLLGAAALFSLPGLHLHGADFSSGSDGSLGALNVLDDTTVDLQKVAPNGRLNYTTVNIAAGKTLRFLRNALNTPVFLLASADIIVAGTIDVSGTQAPNAQGGGAPTGGTGGPGGFDGGKPGFTAEVGPGSGYGPGGGRGGLNDGSSDGAGAGSFGSVALWNPQSQNNDGKVLYGSPLLIPMIGGSGGGGTVGSPGFGGGGGGGAILIASSTSINITGNVFARGGNNLGSSVNAGSGGAIRLLAPIVRGSGLINVQGNNGDGSAGHGRIRVDTIDRSDLRLNFTPGALTTVGADMFVFPPKVPRLDIIETAGTSIPVDTAQLVTVQLPFGADPNRTVTVRAQDFGNKVPISVILTPDSGDPIIVNSQIDNTTQNPASIAVPVTFPQNVLVTVNVWTR
jgi:hypothetical protein